MSKRIRPKVPKSIIVGEARSPCPTDAAHVKKQVLDGLGLMELAIAIESGAACAARVPEPYRGWDGTSGDAHDSFLRPIPRRVREALPFLYRDRCNLFTVEFERIALAAPDSQPIGRISIEPGSSDCAQIGDRLRTGDGQSIGNLVAHPNQFTPTWPPIREYIRQAQSVFSDFARDSVRHFKPAIDDIKGIVIELLGEYRTEWARRDEDPNDPYQVIAEHVEDVRPDCGIPCTELAGRISEVEPAARQKQIECAVRELAKAQLIETQMFTWQPTGRRKSRRGECWVLTDAGRRTLARLEAMRSTKPMGVFEEMDLLDDFPGEPTPQWKLDLGWQVNALIDEHRAIERFRDAMRECAARHAGPLLPPTHGKVYTLQEKRAVMGVMHDFACKGAAKIDPFHNGNTGPSKDGVAYIAWVRAAEELGEEHRPALEAMLRSVRADLESDVRQVAKKLLKAKPFSYSPRPGGWKRLVVSEDQLSVVVDGKKTSRLRSTQDGAFLKALVAKQGGRLTHRALSGACGRPDRCYKRLPKMIQRFVDKPGRGQAGYAIP